MAENNTDSHQAMSTEGNEIVPDNNDMELKPQTEAPDGQAIVKAAETIITESPRDALEVIAASEKKNQQISPREWLTNNDIHSIVQKELSKHRITEPLLTIVTNAISKEVESYLIYAEPSMKADLNAETIKALIQFTINNSNSESTQPANDPSWSFDLDGFTIYAKQQDIQNGFKTDKNRPQGLHQMRKKYYNKFLELQNYFANTIVDLVQIAQTIENSQNLSHTVKLLRSKGYFMEDRGIDNSGPSYQRLFKRQINEMINECAMSNNELQNYLNQKSEKSAKDKEENTLQTEDVGAQKSETAQYDTALESQSAEVILQEALQMKDELKKRLTELNDTLIPFDTWIDTVHKLGLTDFLRTVILPKKLAIKDMYHRLSAKYRTIITTSNKNKEELLQQIEALSGIQSRIDQDKKNAEQIVNELKPIVEHKIKKAEQQKVYNQAEKLRLELSIRINMFANEVFIKHLRQEDGDAIQNLLKEYDRSVDELRTAIEKHELSRSPSQQDLNNAETILSDLLTIKARLDNDEKKYIDEALLLQRNLEAAREKEVQSEKLRSLISDLEGFLKSLNEFEDQDIRAQATNVLSAMKDFNNGDPGADYVYTVKGWDRAVRELKERFFKKQDQQQQQKTRESQEHMFKVISDTYDILYNLRFDSVINTIFGDELESLIQEVKKVKDDGISDSIDSSEFERISNEARAFIEQMSNKDEQHADKPAKRTLNSKIQKIDTDFIQKTDNRTDWGVIETKISNTHNRITAFKEAIERNLPITDQMLTTLNREVTDVEKLMDAFTKLNTYNERYETHNNRFMRIIKDLEEIEPSEHEKAIADQNFLLLTLRHKIEETKYSYPNGEVVVHYRRLLGQFNREIDTFEKMANTYIRLETERRRIMTKAIASTDNVNTTLRNRSYDILINEDRENQATTIRRLIHETTEISTNKPDPIDQEYINKLLELEKSIDDAYQNLQTELEQMVTEAKKLHEEIIAIKGWLDTSSQKMRRNQALMMELPPDNLNIVNQAKTNVNHYFTYCATIAFSIDTTKSTIFPPQSIAELRGTHTYMKKLETDFQQLLNETFTEKTITVETFLNDIAMLNMLTGSNYNNQVHGYEAQLFHIKHNTSLFSEQSDSLSKRFNLFQSSATRLLVQLNSQSLSTSADFARTLMDEWQTLSHDTDNLIQTVNDYNEAQKKGVENANEMLSNVSSKTIELREKYESTMQHYKELLRQTQGLKKIFRRITNDMTATLVMQLQDEISEDLSFIHTKTYEHKDDEDASTKEYHVGDFLNLCIDLIQVKQQFTTSFFATERGKNRLKTVQKAFDFLQEMSSPHYPTQNLRIHKV